MGPTGTAALAGEPREGMMVRFAVANAQGGLTQQTGRITGINVTSGQCDIEILNPEGSGSHTVRAAYSPTLSLGCWSLPPDAL